MYCFNVIFINFLKVVWIFYELLGDCFLLFVDEGIEVVFVIFLVEIVFDYDWVFILSVFCYFVNNFIMFFIWD